MISSINAKVNEETQDIVYIYVNLAYILYRPNVNHTFILCRPNTYKNPLYRTNIVSRIKGL